jgi:hypothetical protein
MCRKLTDNFRYGAILIITDGLIESFCFTSMTSESDSSAIPETYLTKAKQLLDEHQVDESSCGVFFSALQSYLAGDPQTEVLSFSPETAPVWTKVLKLVIKFIEKTPPSPPSSPKTPTSPRTPGGHRTASERISDLIRRSPQKSFQDRVLSSPVKWPGKGDEGTEADVPALSLDFSEEKTKSFAVEMTEADYELLQKKKQERVAVDATVESSDFTIIEVISLSDGD